MSVLRIVCKRARAAASRDVESCRRRNAAAACSLVVRLTATAALLAFVGGVARAATPGAQHPLPYAPCYDEQQWLARIRPLTCTVTPRSEPGQPEANQNHLIKMRWSSWTRLRAVGSAVHPALTNANVNGPRIRVVYDLPKVGCPPNHTGNPTMRTFSRVTFDGEVVRLPIEPCFPDGA